MSDALARSRAVHEYDRSFVVVAGAGTGKTSLLVERVLNQIVETDLDVTELAAITFTEKAAGEMRSRLAAGLARLVELARSPEARAGLDTRREADRAWQHLEQRVPLEQLRERAERHQAQLPRATISTIHGFCAQLLRQFPVEARVDPDFAVDDGLLFDALREDLWHAFLASELGPEGEHAPLWARVLSRIDLAELQALALALSGFDLPPQDEPRPLPDARQVLRPMVEAQLKRNEAELPSEPASGPELFLVAARGVLNALLDDGIDAYRRALDAARYLRQKKQVGLLDGTGAPTSKESPEATVCAKETRRLLTRLLQIDDALLGDALRLTLPFAARVRVAARERAILPFDALLALAHELLAHHPELRRTLGRRYRALFLDEFQDTDPLQYRIVFFMAERGDSEPASDAFQTRLEPGKLFIVGDPKQAIYRFRGADIHAYHVAVRHVEASGGERLALTTSFRSVPEVLEPLDRLFPSLLESDDPANRDAYSGYEKLESALERAGDGPRVEIWTVGDEAGGRRAEGARSDEAQAVAEWIAGEVSADRLRCGDVALLFRSLRNVRLTTRALAERGIRYAVESGRDLLERPEGQQLWSLLRTLANPGDAPALLGLLRSPLGGVSDEQLARYAAGGGTWTYLDERADAQTCPDLARCFAWLREWHRRARRLPVDALLCALADETLLLTLQAAAADGAQRLTNLRNLLDPLTELARAEPTHTLASLIPWLERGDTLRKRVSPGQEDAVRIMSIHAAKGLEFPVVILPDLGRDPNAAGWERGPRAEVAWLPDLGAFALDLAAATSSSWLLHASEEERHEQAESGRLFYVACTRAQQRLILVHAPRKGVTARALVRYLEPWDYPSEGLPADAAPLAPDIATRFISEPGAARLPDAPDVLPDLRPAVRRARAIAEQTARTLKPPFRRATEPGDPEAEPATESDATAPRRRRGVSLGREVGTVIHELLERWDFRDPAAARDLLERAVAAETTRQGGGLEGLREQAAEVLDALLASRLPAYLCGVELIARELPLLFEDAQGDAWSGTLDLLYRDPDGRPVICDYKTDRAPDRATLERYRGQLEIYAAAVRKAFPELAAPALELLLVRSGERVRLPERTIGP